MLPHLEAGKLQPRRMCRRCLAASAAGVLEVSGGGFNNAAALVNTLETATVCGWWVREGVIWWLQEKYRRTDRGE